MRVAILGCGPAGLMAAHAVSLAGHEPVIYSKKVKSQMFGAMYLHKPIYGVCAPKPDFVLDVIKMGTAQEYAEKVYGDPDHPVSFDKYETGQVPGWDLARAYDILWDQYELVIKDATLGLSDITDISFNYALVLSTIPAPALCSLNIGKPRGHEFKSKDIWVVHGIDTTAPVIESYMMYYAGDPTIPWYRYTQLGKYQAWEHASDPSDLGLRTPPFELSTGVKPLSNNCDCPNQNVRRLGRFGKWEKNVLTHHAFEEAGRIVKEEARALQSVQ